MSNVEVQAETTTAPLLAFPTSRYPTGWFQVAWSDEIAPGEVRSLHYFGQDFVIWRGQDGQLRALDAYCLHIGGHLGVNSRVDGDEIVCPWHGWQWDGDGRNTLIPYDTQRCKQNIRITPWTVLEYYGTVLVWHDRAGRPPLWQPYGYKELDSGEFYDMGPDARQVWRVKAHVQNPGENAADFAHIKYVHGAGEPPEYQDYRFEGHIWSARLSAHYGKGKQSTWLTPDGAVEVGVEFANFGIGMGHSRWFAPFTPALMLMNSTPVDDTYIDMHFSMTTIKEEGHDRPAGPARKMIDHQRRTVEQDFYTWENMKILDKPNFTPMETKLWGSYRRWASWFYPETDPRLAGKTADDSWGYNDILVDDGQGGI